MGCINTKLINKPKDDEISLESSFSSLSYIEPIKTKEQKRIEYIQNLFKEEYKNRKNNII